MIISLLSIIYIKFYFSINCNYYFNINHLSSNLFNTFNSNKSIKCNLNDNKYRQYVQIHNWSNVKLTGLINKISMKPLRWRPTDIKPSKFTDDIKLIKNEISKFYKGIINNLKISLHESVKLKYQFKVWKNEFYTKLDNYYHKIIDQNIRNPNISNKELRNIKNLKHTYDDVLILKADKNRGNVVVNKQFWHQFNHQFINKNHKNFVNLLYENNDINNIINHSKNDTKNIIMKYKKYIKDYNKTIKLLHSNAFNQIGSWQAIPKVHKKDEFGNPKKAIRPIINLRNTIITIYSRNFKKNHIWTQEIL